MAEKAQEDILSFVVLNAWAQDQLFALWRNTQKSRFHKRANRPYIRPMFPKSPILQLFLMHGHGYQCKLFFIN